MSAVVTNMAQKIKKEKKAPELKPLKSRKADIWLDETEGMKVYAELPGCDEKTINFTVDPEHVKVEASSDLFHFHGNLILPITVLPDKTKAAYKDGILSLSLKTKKGAVKKEPAFEVEDDDELTQEIFDNLKMQLDKKNKEFELLYNKFERYQHDFESFRARTKKDKEDYANRQVENVITNMLLVADNVETAIRTTDPETCDAQNIYKGLELLNRMFKDALKSAQIEEICEEMVPFDPKYHDAVAEVPNKDVEEHTVLAIQQKGYIYNGKVLRPARVVVSKK